MTIPPLSAPGGSDEVTLLGLARDILRRRNLLIGLPLGFAVLAVVAGWRMSGFASESSFSLQSGTASKSPAADLAAQLGVSVTVFGTSTDSPDFYAALFESRALLEQAVLTEYRVPPPGEPTDTVGHDLIQLFRVPQGWAYRLHLKPRTQKTYLQDAIDRLSARLTVDADPISGIVSVTVQAPSPVLAEQINRQLLREINDFNLQTRQSSASEQRRFVESRIAEVQKELTEAEAEMAAFLQENRTYHDSPRLTFEADQLQRRVILLQSVAATLAQTHEQSRIDEVRDTPVITVIDKPEGSAVSTFRPVLLAVLGLFGGGVIGVGLALAGAWLSRLRWESPDEFAEVVQLSKAAVAVLSPARLWRRIVRRKAERAA